MSNGPIIIMAGGTGGHVFPALAVAETLRAQSREVVWMGTQRGIEARVVPNAGIPIEWVSVRGLRGKQVTTWLAAPFSLIFALIQSVTILRRRRPAAVLGMGGFVAGPGGLAAWLLRRPLIIHEQNAVAGLTNRILARFAGRVLEGFPGAFKKNHAPQAVGNPVRADIAALPAPDQRFAGRSGPLRLLVIGGSQGASVLNRTVPAALALVDTASRPVVRHQSGERKFDEAQKAYRDAGVDADITRFVDDMAAAYDWADLVICRAGAITIAELSAAGLGAILVPFPYAVDDHQTRNAEFLSGRGAAELLPEGQLTAAVLAEKITTLDRDRLLAMAGAARECAKPDAASTLADACLEAAGSKGASQ